ncbi:GNAT family N-acetyltransferase [Sorangium cellulosum]|uniref:N-acetyltransferase domain-containing protein n=1 Tax=Sorangium cellulosum TaxID=56 RepID=A0A150QUI0_SORCE|nr:GNAT family N-acetyltransferase [Sorangium cellulosum]KYF71659.1 hypothetical protein BE15_34055 [Sorangium cellulosum]
MHIELVKVKKEHRGKGRDIRLMLKALEASGDVRYITLVAWDDGTGKLLKWYEALGFEKYPAATTTLPAYRIVPNRLRQAALTIHANEL